MDRFDELAGGRLLDPLCDRDESGAKCFQYASNLDVPFDVARETIEFVDDYKLNPER